jgi:hypothetical protein
MSKLADIEKAVEQLSLEQKQELLEFLAALLRAESNGTPSGICTTCRARGRSEAMGCQP